MTEKMIIDAYCHIRKNDNTISDDILDFLKDAAIEKLRASQINEERQTILKKAISFFGTDVQINKIQEEALELSLVLNQIKCPTKDKEKMQEDLYDELADMSIMMAQAELLFDKMLINERVNFKLNKLNTKYLLNHEI